MIMMSEIIEKGSNPSIPAEARAHANTAHKQTDPAWFEQLPKIELHLHLEGAIPHDTLWDLVQKYGSNVPSKKALKHRFEYKDFANFIDTWLWKNQFIREYDDFTHIAESVARDLAKQHIYYAEVFFSPPDFFQHGLETQRIAEAIRKGLDKEKGVEIALVADLVRDFGPERGAKTLAEVYEVKQYGILGVGIGGSEKEHPPEAFESVFSKAQKLGFYTSAHAGEAAGPESVWGAINHLRVNRIGHGTNAVMDRVLFNHIIENQIPVEMCPISNVRTGVVDSYAAHPVKYFFEQGVLLCINTDDPKMFGNSLAEEYRLLMEIQGLKPADIKKMIFNAINMSWMPAAKKQDLTAAFTRDPAWSTRTEVD